ncbi:MAG: polysaccharide pyruvyl transferase CsaB [Oscillospiraceae bacterium]|nr:polysaccharide pyruvyl transferase CsaB [Oscillospiraceae bacterium]
MNVLTLISGGDVGGAKTHVLTLLRELSRTMEIRLVCFMEAEFTEDARAMGLDPVIMRGSIPSVVKRLRAYVAEEGFDIIHSHGSRGNFLSSLLGVKNIPRVSTVHSDWRLDYMGRPLAALTYGVLNALALRGMDYLVAVSDPMAELLIKRGFAPDRIFTVYNGVDMAVQERPSREGAETVNVGIAARLNPVKDVETLVRGFSEAAKERPELRLRIAGDGPEEGRLKKLADQLGAADKIEFLGWVEDVDGFYATLDVNTLTSISETFPYALTEGARWGLATVATRVGGVPKLIDSAVSGILIEPGDAKALAAALVRLASDAELRRDMGEKLHEKTARLFSLEATRDTMTDIYATVLRRHSKRNEKRRGVAVCGAYGRGNSGDEAILEAIISEIREADPDVPITVLSVEPRQTATERRVRAIHTFRVLAFARLARKCSLYINGGGSLIQNVTSRRSLWFYLYTLAAAHRSGAKVVMYGCGIGPVTGAGDRRLAARVINKNVDVITLREDGSAAELAELGVTKPEIRLAADPSLFLGSAPDDRVDSIMLAAGLETRGRYICFTLRSWPGFEERADDFARAAEFAWEKLGLQPVFVPINHLEDVSPARAVAARLKCPHTVLTGQLNGRETAGLMSRMAVVVSMRLHGLIFAAGHGVPLVGVVYDPKVSGFLKYIGQDLFCGLEAASGLCELIERAAARGSSAEQETAVAALRGKERVNREILRRYLG